MNHDRLFDLALASFLVFAGCGRAQGEARCDHDHTDPTSSTPPAPTTPDPARADVDQDGVSVADGDCDDFNDTIYPGAPETGWDGVDSDCDDEDGPTIHAEHPGPRSFEDFVQLCDSSAALDGSLRPGLIELHAACSAVNTCRGMFYGDWGEDAILTEHSCRAMNWCVGWSCVEAGPGIGVPVEEAYQTHCAYCHGYDAATPRFDVMVPPGQDPATVVSDFANLPDERIRSAIAFGKYGITSSGRAYANMPGFVKSWSRQEIDAMVAYVKTLPATTTYEIRYPDDSTIP